MALTIHMLDYGDIELETSFLVLGHECGRVRRVPVYGFLILGGRYPVLVDTGYRDNAIMETLGMRGLQFHDNMIENQLARHGLRLGDIRYILHTHLHIDHAGKDDLFPMNTTVVLNRREMEFSVSGIMYPQYPKPDIKHLVDRIYEPNALRFLDLEITEAEEIIPGVWCEPARAHTEGSMNVVVETAEGLAGICGDVIYDFNDQIVNHVRVVNAMEPQVTGNHAGSKRSEKAAIKRLLNNYRFLLPIHDQGAKIEHGQVVGRLGQTCPGPLRETLPERHWFAA
ncbi:MAG: N-acyl homoserine lactonase family protein [Paracoccaceae bacterium]